MARPGPLSDRPGYDPVLQAESGMMSVNGEANGEGLRHAIAIVDTMTAIHSVAAINAALFARHDTGKGQQIDLALYDTALAEPRQHGLVLPDRRRPAAPRGNGHFASAPNSSFETKNGKIYMAVANQKLFTDTCKAMGHPEMVDRPALSTIAARVAKPELTRLMEEVLKTDTKELDAEIPPSAGWADPHHEGGARRARRSSGAACLKTYQHTRVGAVPLIGSNYRFSDTPVDDTARRPRSASTPSGFWQDIAGPQRR